MNLITILQAKNYNLQTSSGFSLVEVILAGSIFMLIVGALVGALIYGQESTILSGARAQAVFLAEEGIEAARNIRDEDFSNLVDGAYGLQISGGTWTLVGSNDTIGVFTRQINISTVDDNTKQITVDVSWQQNLQRQGNVILTTYLTNWMILSGVQADSLFINTDNTSIHGGDNTKVLGVLMENTGVADIIIDQITVSWSGASGGTKINDIYIDGASVWTGNGNSGTTLDISDFTLLSGSGFYVMDFLDFSKDMTGVSITLDFIMLDGSSTSVTFTPGVGVDTIAPSAVTDLTAINPTATTIDLTWTAPGDDGNIGTATSYDIRYSTTLITDVNWSLASQLTGEPSPSTPGSLESITVTGLSSETLYYFAIKTSDEVNNVSLLSNISSATTLVASGDTTPPSGITDLSATNPTSSTVDLSWTAPGDDGNIGTATSYDIRYSTALITESNWASASQVIGEPTPLSAGSSQLMTVSGLSGGTTYYFAIKTSDEVPNTSTIFNVPSATTLSFIEADNLNVDISQVAIDGADSSKVIGIIIENIGGTNIVISQMTLTWTGVSGGAKLNGINIGGGSVWTGTGNSGTTIDITDFTLVSGAGTYPINFFDFSKNATGITFSIDFVMSDGSIKTVSNIIP